MLYQFCRLYNNHRGVRNVSNLPGMEKAAFVVLQDVRFVGCSFEAWFSKKSCRLRCSFLCISTGSANNVTL